MKIHAQTEMAHNIHTSGNGSCPVIVSYDSIEPDDLANWHEATDDEYQAYLDYWNTDLKCGHTRGECSCVLT